MSSKGKRWSKLMAVLLTLAMTACFIAEAPVDKALAAGMTPQAIYQRLMDAGRQEPDDWTSDKDPYGYGIDNDFMLITENELATLKSNGRSGGLTVKSYDTLKAENTGNVFSGVGDSWSKTLSSGNTLSYVRSVAFDPTGCGRKDHIAVIGVYSSKVNDPNNNPPKMYVYVMNNKGDTSSVVELGQASWMCNDNSLNNRNVWDFNMMNFLDITAGDYNGDGHESLVVWGCSSNPFLK